MYGMDKKKIRFINSKFTTPLYIYYKNWGIIQVLEKAHMVDHAIVHER